jgi:CBS domain-containing protein
MSRDVLTASPDMPFKAVVERLILGGVSGLPVVDDGWVVGVVSETDLMTREEQGAGSAVMWWTRHLSRLADQDSAAVEQALAELSRAVGRTAGDLMTSPAMTIGPDVPLGVAAGLMHRQGLKRLPVVDGDGRLIGIVTRSDLLKVFMLTDGAIERAARDVLEQVLAEPDAVVVSVNEGVVTLAGSVEAEPELEAVVMRIEQLPGVVGVEDGLRAAL